MDSLEMPNCWICGSPASTGEHIPKKSDLKSNFPTPNQQSPLYYSDYNKRNIPIGSFNNLNLTIQKIICADCNNNRTQPHDLAWEDFSRKLSDQINLNDAEIMDNICIAFPIEDQLKIHLYFVKLFGCLIIERGVPIDISGFSKAILDNIPHPNMYLKLGLLKNKSVGPTEILIKENNTYATWFLDLGAIAVNVIYSKTGCGYQGLQGAWHPRFLYNNLTLNAFN